MSKFDYGLYDVRRAGHQEDLRTKSTELSDAKTDAYNAMIKLILEHKKEITKVPAATTIAGATAWASKRPGFRATLEDIGGDSEKEVVVFDKAGNPFMINGYKLKPSDYGLRKAYWEANPTSESRAANPMREWSQDYVWDTKEDPTNIWNQTVTKNTANYDKMKAWGYRMPTKPKTELSPYSIFSKAVAPIVKSFFDGNILVTKLTESPPSMGKRPGENNVAFIKKLISPISIYRFLFMRLIEQKYFFSLIESDQTRANVRDYDTYKRFVKEHKSTFRNWFLTHVMEGAKKENIKSAWVSAEIIGRNLVRRGINWDGRDILDGIVYLLGLKNINMNTGEQFTFKDLIGDNDTAGDFLAALKEKKSPYYKDAKRLMERFKRNSQESTDSYFKDDRLKKLLFQNKEAYDAFMHGVSQGVPQITAPEDVAPQQMAANAPASPPKVTMKMETEKPAVDMDDTVDIDILGPLYAKFPSVPREQIDLWVQEAEANDMDHETYISLKLQQ